MKFFNLAHRIGNLYQGLPATKWKNIQMKRKEQKEKQNISWYLLDSCLILHDNTISVVVKLTNHRIPLQCVCIVNFKCFTLSLCAVHFWSFKQKLISFILFICCVLPLNTPVRSSSLCSVLFFTYLFLFVFNLLQRFTEQKLKTKLNNKICPGPEWNMKWYDKRVRQGKAERNVDISITCSS